MKKLVLILFVSHFTVILLGWSTFRNNVVMRKISPARSELTSDVKYTLTNTTLTPQKVNKDMALTATIGAADYYIAANDATMEEKAVANIVCDGTADQVQINDALTSGYNVRLSGGTFNITEPITTSINNVTIEGAGKEKTTIFLSNGSNCNVLTIGGNYWNIKNLLIDGNLASNITTGSGIYGRDFTNVKISDCEIKNIVLNGIAIGDASSDWIIENCYIHDVGSGCIFGYQENPSTSSPSNIKIIKCHLHNSVLESQIRTQPDNFSYPAFDWNIDQCLFTGTTGYKGVLFSGSKNCNISDCYFNVDTVLIGTGYAANIRYYKGASGTISKNTFVASKAIEIWGASDVTIINNYFTGQNSDRQDCIRIEAYENNFDANNINIEGNTFYNISMNVAKPAIVLYAVDTHKVSKVNIVGNTFMDDRGASSLCQYAIVVVGTGTIKNVNIFNNTMEGMLNSGIEIVATSIEDFIISNNIFIDHPIGINATDWSNLIINGNRFTNCAIPMNKW